MDDQHLRLWWFHVHRPITKSIGGLLHKTYESSPQRVDFFNSCTLFPPFKSFLCVPRHSLATWYYIVWALIYPYLFLWSCYLGYQFHSLHVTCLFCIVFLVEPRTCRGVLHVRHTKSFILPLHGDLLKISWLWGSWVVTTTRVWQLIEDIFYILLGKTEGRQWFKVAIRIINLNLNIRLLMRE